MKRLAAFFILVSPLLADELKLKTGKTIEWTDLHDGGDVYEVTTPQGTKVTVKKDEVDSLVPRKAPEILTGAAITFDKKKKLETVDVLATVDIKKDIVSGPWKMNGRALSGGPGSAESVSKFQFSGFTSIPEEYDLTVVVEKKETTNGIFFGLIGGGHQFLVGFDYQKCSMSGIVTKMESNIKEGRAVPGRFFSAKSPRTLKFMVRKEALVVQVDGKDFIAWKADWSLVDVGDMWAVPSRNSFLLAIHDSSNYIISSMVLTAPKEKQ
jgi:hypothetical protein